MPGCLVIRGTYITSVSDACPDRSTFNFNVIDVTLNAIRFDQNNAVMCSRGYEIVEEPILFLMPLWTYRQSGWSPEFGDSSEENTGGQSPSIEYLLWEHVFQYCNFLLWPCTFFCRWCNNWPKLCPQASCLGTRTSWPASPILLVRSLALEMTMTMRMIAGEMIGMTRRGGGGGGGGSGISPLIGK